MNLAAIPRFLRLAVFALAVLIVIWASLVPNDELPAKLTFWDKAEHALAYLGLGFLATWTYYRRPWTWIVMLVLLGSGIEVMQSVMPNGRQGDLKDAVANGLGVFVGVGLAIFMRKIMHEFKWSGYQG